jgi:hypothetical protein
MDDGQQRTWYLEVGQSYTQTGIDPISISLRAYFSNSTGKNNSTKVTYTLYLYGDSTWTAVGY